MIVLFIKKLHKFVDSVRQNKCQRQIIQSVLKRSSRCKKCIKAYCNGPTAAILVLSQNE